MTTERHSHDHCHPHMILLKTFCYSFCGFGSCSISFLILLIRHYHFGDLEVDVGAMRAHIQFLVWCSGSSSWIFRAQGCYKSKHWFSSEINAQEISAHVNTGKSILKETRGRNLILKYSYIFTSAPIIKGWHHKKIIPVLASAVFLDISS